MVEKKQQETSVQKNKTEEKDTIPVKKKNQKKIIILLVSVALVGIIVAFFYSKLVNYLTEIPEVLVPNILGMDERDALDVLESHKLQGNLVGKRFSEETTSNQVLEIRPEQGTRVKAGRKVDYVLSEGKDVIYLKSIIGLDLDEAMVVLTENGFVLEKVGDIFSSEYKQGVIISQDPLPGEYYVEGTVVKVLVSTGYPVNIDITKIQPGYDRLLVKINLKVLESETVKKVNIKIVSIRQDGSQLLYNEDVFSGKEVYFELEDEIGARIEVYYNDVLATAKKVLL